VYESIKRVAHWAAFYKTHNKTSYYPKPNNSISLYEVPTMPNPPKCNMVLQNRQLMRDWASSNGKCVRQRTIRQETTKFKAGTLPLNMYNKKVPLPPRMESLVDVESTENNDDDDGANCLSNQSDDLVDEFDSDDDSDESYDQALDSGDETTSQTTSEEIPRELEFLLGRTSTRSGRMIKVSTKRLY